MKADINVTPLIDVLLVLLIIFMTVAPVAPRALDAALPEERRKDDGPAPPALVLDVHSEQFALNSVPVLTLGQLDDALRAAFATRHDTTLFVRPSSDISYSRLVAALDVAKGAGAARLALVPADSP